MSTVSESIFRRLAEQLAPMVATWHTILLLHRRGPNGYCSAPTCGRPGYGTPDWQPHPCGARALAELARTLHERAERGAARNSAGSPSR